MDTPAARHGRPDRCAIDFGTSNSGIAVPGAHGGVELVELEPGQPTMPTAVFYAVDDPRAAAPQRLYGRAALAAYVDGLEGRLMRSMKSVLGSSLFDQHTDVGGGHAVRHADVVAGYLNELKRRAESAHGAPLTRVVLGRPVHFVDDDAGRDAAAQAALEAAARRVGFEAVAFEYEPIAAALDHERTLDAERLVLVADIGGGTSDFSLVRLGPQRARRAERGDDILGNHGVHLAGTDFDRHLELAAVLPPAGYRGRTPEGREVPSRVYFDLATWHLINTVYAPARVAELRRMRDFYAEPRQHERLMTIVMRRLGHALAARAEEAKIDLAESAEALEKGIDPGDDARRAGSATTIDLGLVEPGLAAVLDGATALAAIDADVGHIAAAARETVRRASVDAARVDTLYFTGGSTGLGALAARIAAGFPGARLVHGDRHASVVRGLGLAAQRRYG